MAAKSSPITVTHAHLLDEWDYDKNIRGPENYSHGSHKRVWWLCDKGHSWVAIVRNRIDLKRGCPYCSNYYTKEGLNDLSTTHPNILKEWNYKKNSILPTEINSGCKKKVWWRCKLGHEWKAQIVSRVMNNRGCPYCAGQRVLKGFNDLTTIHPDLVDSWDHAKNTVLPTEVSKGSNNNRWWLCDKGHSYEMSVCDRVRGRECSVCSSKRIVVGFNDFASNSPLLLKEWDYEKNDFGPECYSKSSDKKVWWLCDKGHGWRASIKNRKKGSGCPHCSCSSTSISEKDLVKFAFSITNKDIVENTYSVISPYELDIYIPELNVAIEFNGNYWHSDEKISLTHKMNAREYHQMKINMCQEQGIDLLFVWEDDWDNRHDEVKTALKEYFESRIPSPMFGRLE